LLEEISQLVRDFLEASRNFIFDFLHKKTTENCENHKRSFKKYFFDVKDLQKQYSSRDNVPNKVKFFKKIMSIGLKQVPGSKLAVA
jgi:hypothetical protein